jgi:hypothetical protein
VREHQDECGLGRDETWTPTAEVAQVGRLLAMGDEATFNAMLDAVESPART